MLEKFKLGFKKEVFYYLLTLLVLTLIMHIDLLSDPLARIQLMQEKGNYLHPFLYTFFIYAPLFIVRKTIDFIAKMFEKKAH